MSPRRTTLAATLLLAPMLATAAHAEPPATHRSAPSASAVPPAPPPAPATPAPDLILLKNGGMIRGTISEMMPGEAVNVITVGGATKRIPMSDVSYAGPADKAPKAATKEADVASPEKAAESSTPENEDVRPFITVRSKPVSFKFVSQEPGLTLLLKTGEAEAVGWTGTPTGITAVSYTPICTAPCLAALPAGAHQFALSKDTGRPVSTPELASLRERSTIEGIYQSRQGVRTAGWVIGVSGVITGLVLVFTGFNTTTSTCPSSDAYCVPQTERHLDNLYWGMGIGVGSALIGMLMARTSDSADVKISPRSVSAGD